MQQRIPSRDLIFVQIQIAVHFLQFLDIWHRALSHRCSLTRRPKQRSDSPIEYLRFRNHAAQFISPATPGYTLSVSKLTRVVRCRKMPDHNDCVLAGRNTSLVFAVCGRIYNFIKGIHSPLQFTHISSINVTFQFNLPISQSTEHLHSRSHRPVYGWC